MQNLNEVSNSSRAIESGDKLPQISPPLNFLGARAATNYSIPTDYSDTHQERKLSGSEEKTDPDLLAKFESLALDESDNEEYPAELRSSFKPTRPRLEPKRHTSDLPRLLTEWNAGWSKQSPQPSTHSPQVSQTDLASVLPTGTANKPPGLSALHRHNCYQHPYSSNNLPQVISNVPVYPMTSYYVSQPNMMPIPVVYGYFNYPQVPYKMTPRRYLSSTYLNNKQECTQQVYPELIPTSDTVGPIVAEGALAVIKEYEKSGDFTKLAGKICKLARLQAGSRFLQKEIERGGQGFLSFAIGEVVLVM
jgi:hypothetical protein